MKASVLIGIVVLVIVVGIVGVYFVTSSSTPSSTLTQQVTTTSANIRLAAIFPGTIQDSDYNTLGYLAIKTVESELGIKVAYSERVAVPDAERVIQEYISLGYNVIWTHGAQFNAATLKLARENPRTTFIIETDAPIQDQPNNVWIIDRNFPPGFYVLGAIAAMSSKTGIIGYLGGVDLPFSKAEVNAVLMAIKDINPKVQLKYLWVGDFNDPVKARSITETLIASGADIILTSVNLGVYGVFEAAQTAPFKVLVTVKYTDKSSMAPNNVITSYIYDFSNALKNIINQISRGITSGYYKLQYGKDIYVLFPLKNVSQEVSDKAKEINDKISRGEIQIPFNTTLPS